MSDEQKAVTSVLIDHTRNLVRVTFQGGETQEFSFLDLSEKAWKRMVGMLKLLLGETDFDEIEAL